MIHTYQKKSKLPIKAYVKPVTPEVGPLLAQGYNLNKCGRGLLDDTYIPKVKALGLVVSDKKIFSCCSQPVTPEVGPLLAQGL